MNNLSIKAKLLTAIVVAITLVSLIVVGQGIYSLTNTAESIIKKSEQEAFKNKEEELKNYVSLAYKTIENYYDRTSKDKIKNEVKDYIVEQSGFLFSILENEYEKNRGKLSDAELKNRLISIIESTRYGKSGYFWINDFDYKMIMHPIKKELTGQYFKDTPKVPFVQLGADELKRTGEDRGFIEYSFFNPSSQKTVFKSSIVRVFKPYNWIIGTGAYIDDVTEKMREEALQAIANMKYGKSGYFWVNDSHPKMLMHPIKPALVGKDLSENKDANGKKHFIEMVKVVNASKDGGLVTYMWDRPGKVGAPRQKFSYVKRFEPWDMIIGTGAYVDDIDEKIAVMHEETTSNIKSLVSMTVIMILVIVTLVILVIIFFMKRVIFNPLNELQNGLLNFFKYVNKESDSVDLLKVNNNDEIGSMSNIINENIKKSKKIIDDDNIVISEVKNVVNEVSRGLVDKRIKSSTENISLNELKTLLNNMLDSLEQLVGKDISKLTNVLEKYAKRDFTARLDSSSCGKLGVEIINMNRMLTNILRDNKEDGERLQSSANDLSSNVTVLSKNATSQAASLEETAASIEEIKSNITQTNEKAKVMQNISVETKHSATVGKELAQKTVTSMDEINETVQSINEAITFIDQIAFQTNILSLNAAVEAATAGEAGKGFAVVAQEVRNLAARSAEVAKDIKSLVEKATSKAEDGKVISSKMIEGFKKLEDDIIKSTELIDDVSVASNEQSLGMIQISDAINALDRFTQENASIAERAKRISEETNSIASDIVESVNTNKFDS